MAKITSIRYYRVKPRWLMVKIIDENGQHGWGEATLEGHDLAVEGCLEEMIPRIIGKEAKYVPPRQSAASFSDGSRSLFRCSESALPLP